MKNLLFIACMAVGMFAISCTGNKGQVDKKCDQKDCKCEECKCEKSECAEQNNSVKTIKTSEIILNEAYEMIKPDSTLFTGVVWSDDGKTFKIIAKDGQPEETFTYHENGQLAISSHNDDMGNEVNAYFDEEGKEMTEDDFMAKYQSVIERREAVWGDNEEKADEAEEAEKTVE